MITFWILFIFAKYDVASSTPHRDVRGIHFPHPFKILSPPHVTIDVDIDLSKLIDKIKAVNSSWQTKALKKEEGKFSKMFHWLGELEMEADVLPVLVKHNRDKVVPEEFDARQQWPSCSTIRRIRDQGSCSSCWAVATASTFSDRACIARLSGSTLSEVDVMSCCADCGKGCSGGSSQLAWKYFQESGAPTGGSYNSSEGCQPYMIQSCEHGTETNGYLPLCSSLPYVNETSECQKTCTNPAYRTPYEKDILKVEKAYLLKNNVTEIQLEILYNGPVTAVMEVFTDFFTYHSGIYHHVEGVKMGLHAVRILGWGKEGGLDYWLIANSWNPNWGEGGTFRIRRGVNECRIEEKVTAGLPRLDPAKALFFHFFGAKKNGLKQMMAE